MGCSPGRHSRSSSSSLAVGVVALYSAGVTAGILFVVNLIVPIRVPHAEEEAGLDLAQHGEIAYQA